MTLFLSAAGEFVRRNVLAVRAGRLRTTDAARPRNLPEHAPHELKNRNTPRFHAHGFILDTSDPIAPTSLPPSD